MSLHAHIHQPEAVDFFITNPPTLTNREKRIYENNILKQPIDHKSRILTVVSHVNDPVFGLGSHYLPPGTKVYSHGDKNENKIIAHAKVPDCCKTAAELEFLEFDNNQGRKNYSWKIIKAFLFMTILLIHVISLPYRVINKFAQNLSEFYDKEVRTWNKYRNSIEDGQINEEMYSNPYSQYESIITTPKSSLNSPSGSPRFFAPQQASKVEVSIEYNAQLSTINESSGSKTL